jgi:hypothetical protein
MSSLTCSLAVLPGAVDMPINQSVVAAEPLGVPTAFFE